MWAYLLYVEIQFDAKFRVYIRTLDENIRVYIMYTNDLMQKLGFLCICIQFGEKFIYMQNLEFIYLHIL